MKITLTCGSPSWGGLEMQTLKISEELLKRGHEVTLFCRPESSLKEKASQFNLSVKPILEKDIYLIRNIYKLKTLFQNEIYDVVHTHLSHDLWSIVPALQLARNNTRLLMSKRMCSSVMKKDIGHRYLYDRIDRILAVSNFIRQNVINTCPINPQRVFTLYNGLDLTMFNPECINKKEVRSELGIDPDAVVIGLVGRITPMKGHVEFLQAARQIHNEIRMKLIFLIVGEASYREKKYEQEIRSLVLKLQIEDKVIFTGFREDVPRMMAGIDILVFPSYKESFPNTVLEGMAMKLPLIACNSGAVSEVVLEGETGLLVPPKSANLLAEKLLILLKDQELCHQFGENGRKRVEKHFRFDQFISSLENCYMH